MGKLRVALGVVAGAVKLVQKEARRRLVLRRRQQVGIGAGKAARLICLMCSTAAPSEGLVSPDWRNARTRATAARMRVAASVLLEGIC